MEYLLKKYFDYTEPQEYCRKYYGNNRTFCVYVKKLYNFFFYYREEIDSKDIILIICMSLTVIFVVIYTLLTDRQFQKSKKTRLIEAQHIIKDWKILQKLENCLNVTTSQGDKILQICFEHEKCRIITQQLEEARNLLIRKLKHLGKGIERFLRKLPMRKMGEKYNIKKPKKHNLNRLIRQVKRKKQRSLRGFQLVQYLWSKATICRSILAIFKSTQKQLQRKAAKAKKPKKRRPLPAVALGVYNKVVDNQQKDMEIAGIKSKKHAIKPKLKVVTKAKTKENTNNNAASKCRLAKMPKCRPNHRNLVKSAYTEITENFKSQVAKETDMQAPVTAVTARPLEKPKLATKEKTTTNQSLIENHKISTKTTVKPQENKQEVKQIKQPIAKTLKKINKPKKLFKKQESVQTAEQEPVALVVPEIAAEITKSNVELLNIEQKIANIVSWQPNKEFVQLACEDVELNMQNLYKELGDTQGIFSVLQNLQDNNNNNQKMVETQEIDDNELTNTVTESIEVTYKVTNDDVGNLQDFIEKHEEKYLQLACLSLEDASIRDEKICEINVSNDECLDNISLVDNFDLQLPISSELDKYDDDLLFENETEFVKKLDAIKLDQCLDTASICECNSVLNIEKNSENLSINENTSCKLNNDEPEYSPIICELVTTNNNNELEEIPQEEEIIGDEKKQIISKKTRGNKLRTYKKLVNAFEKNKKTERLLRRHTHDIVTKTTTTALPECETPKSILIKRSRSDDNMKYDKKVRFLIEEDKRADDMEHKIQKITEWTDAAAASTFKSKGDSNEQSKAGETI